MPDQDAALAALIEQLAALEHEQWAHWTAHLLAHQTPANLARWQQQIATPYAALSEADKEKDRAWARRILALLQAHPHLLAALAAVPPQAPE
jgi:hypothetical protein